MASTDEQQQQQYDDPNIHGVNRTDTIEEPTVHHYGEAYSKKHPVPTIPRFLRHQRERAEESKKQEAELADQRKRDEEETKKTTGDEKGEEKKSNIAKPPKDARTSDVPIGDDKTNVLFHPPPEVEMSDIFTSIKEHTLQAAYISAAAIVLLDFLFIGGGFVGFLKSLLPAGGIGFAVFFVLNQVVESAHSMPVSKSQPSVEKLKYVPESVEWLNTLLDTVWQVVSEDVFKQVAQQVEDQVKAFIPVDFVKFKVPEIGHGTRPLRVLSMRSLPDSEFGELVAAHGDTKGMSQEEIAQQETKVKNEMGGIFYNLEVALAYHAEALGGHKKRIHFDIAIVVGGVPIPIFIETREFVMTLRIRLQMHPDLPFLKHVTFALTEPPKILAGVAIGHGGAFNLLSLPLLDNLITSQIAANTKELTVPKSMSIDMTPILGGGDAVTETESVGLLYLKISRAENLRRQDRTGGGADPYITISFSKYEKPMYATKMIIGDLNPVWEEQTCILINAEHVKRQESLLVKLWDSDRNGKDDVTGQVEVPLVDLIKDYETVQKRQDALQHEVAGADTQGILHWEVGFFPEANFDRKQLNLEEAKKDPKVTDKTKEEDIELTPLNCRPDPEYPTGILSVTIYQCINIEVPNPKQKKQKVDEDETQQSLPETKDSEATKESESDSEEESDTAKIEGYLPSVYCTADINDEFACRTRMKSITKAPIYNSTVEKYITDWRNIVVSVAARDHRRKGRDFLVGSVVLKAADIFKNSSAVSDWYDFVGGGGSGRVRIALLFRSTTVKLLQHELGWNVGRFEFCSEAIKVNGLQAGKLKLKTCGGVKNLTPSAEAKDTFEISNSLLRVPVFNRYLAPLIFQFYNGSGDRKAAYYSIIWLHNLIDNETRDFDLTIYKTDKPKRFTQNCIEGIPDKHCKTEAVGTVHFKARFRSGMCPEFKEYLNDQDEEDTFEVWESMDKLGLRDVHEADTGAGHAGIITGTDNMRDPATTQAEHISNGGTGRYGDKEARNVDSEKTGTMAEPALSDNEVQDHLNSRSDLRPPSDWEAQHGRGATEAPFENPDTMTEQHPMAPLVGLANETAPPSLTKPQDIKVVSQEEYEKSEKDTGMPALASPSSTTSSQKRRVSQQVRSMLDVPDITPESSQDNLATESSSIAPSDAVISDSTATTTDSTAPRNEASNAITTDSTVPRNANFNIDRADNAPEIARRQSDGTEQSAEINSVQSSPNPNYFASSSNGGNETHENEELHKQADMIPRLEDTEKDSVPRSLEQEQAELNREEKPAGGLHSVADKIRQAVPGNGQ